MIHTHTHGSLLVYMIQERESIVFHLSHRMAGIGDMKETIVTTKEPWDHQVTSHTLQRYTIAYTTTSKDPLMGSFFLAVLSSICTNLYASTCRISCRSTSPATSSFFLYDISLDLQPPDSTKKSPEIKLSSDPRHLGISVSLFSRAFPWHFVLDRNLNIVQMGISLLKLLTPRSTTSARVTDFFEFVRPDLGVTDHISFESVYRRLNTPFLFRLTKNGACNKCAEVRWFLIICPRLSRSSFAFTWK